MIRIAGLSDIDQVTEMAMKFATTTNYADFVVESKVKEVVKSMLEKNIMEAIVLINDGVGLIAGTVIPFTYGHALMATEVAWWVDPEHRKTKAGIELLEAFEHWAKTVGCKLITMSCLDNKIAKYYTKKGYHLTERAYMKEI